MVVGKPLNVAMTATTVSTTIVRTNLLSFMLCPLLALLLWFVLVVVSSLRRRSRLIRRRLCRRQLTLQRLDLCVFDRDRGFNRSFGADWHGFDFQVRVLEPFFSNLAVFFRTVEFLQPRRYAGLVFGREVDFRRRRRGGGFDFFCGRSAPEHLRVVFVSILFSHVNQVPFKKLINTYILE